VSQQPQLASWLRSCEQPPHQLQLEQAKTENARALAHKEKEIAQLQHSKAAGTQALELLRTEKEGLAAQLADTTKKLESLRSVPSKVLNPDSLILGWFSTFGDEETTKKPQFAELMHLFPKTNVDWSVWQNPN
jgi:hypothetical protein